jgi:predicted DNA-binding transcriptional regulator AlpA
VNESKKQGAPPGARERLAQALRDAVAAIEELTQGEVAIEVLSVLTSARSQKEKGTQARSYLSPAEVAKDLGVSRSLAYDLVRQMGPLHIGRSLRVSRQSYEKWLAAHCTPSTTTSGLRSVGLVPIDPWIARMAQGSKASTRPIVPRTKPRLSSTPVAGSAPPRGERK